MKPCFVTLVLWICGGQFLVGQIPVQLSTRSVSIPDITSKRAGPHGGVLSRLDQVGIETVMEDSGVEIYLYGTNSREIPVGKARGLVHLKVDSSAQRYRYDLLPSGGNKLSAHVNLSHTIGKQVELEVQLIGLPGISQSVRFRETISIPPSRIQRAASAIARQKMCPVSGRPLGSMGDPLSVAVGDKTVFVCSAACENAVKSDPTRYATGKPTILVSTATDEDSALIAKQGICPVMDETLGGMGQPIKVMIGDKPVFLCCKGCVKKIEAEPAKYLTMVYGSASSGTQGTGSLSGVKASVPINNPLRLQASTSTALRIVSAGLNQVRPGVFEVTDADTPFIEAQKKCPVMDEPLDGMGGPYKVSAAGRAIYICCPGCAKRIAAEPQEYLSLLEKQGIQAPMIH